MVLHVHLRPDVGLNLRSIREEVQVVAVEHLVQAPVLRAEHPHRLILRPGQIRPPSCCFFQPLLLVLGVKWMEKSSNWRSKQMVSPTAQNP